jgi:hypothetical protein
MVAELLGDLPLAIEQASAWLAETAMPVTGYVARLEDRVAVLGQAGAARISAVRPGDVAAFVRSPERTVAGGGSPAGTVRVLRAGSDFAVDAVRR